MMIAMLQRLLDTNTIQLDSVGLLISEVNLKVLLLYNGNKFPSVPLDHTAEMKESYESMKVLLENIKYKKI
jgi:hypothetical protein